MITCRSNSCDSDSLTGLAFPTFTFTSSFAVAISDKTGKEKEGEAGDEGDEVFTGEQGDDDIREVISSADADMGDVGPEELDAVFALSSVSDFLSAISPPPNSCCIIL